MGARREVYFTIELISINQAIDYYLLTESRVRKTTQSYNYERKVFEDFADFLLYRMKIDIFETNLFEVAPSHVAKFQMWLSNQKNKYSGEKLSPSTVNRKMNAIRNFFSTCYYWEWTTKNLCKGLKTLRESKSHKKPWTKFHYHAVRAELSGRDRELFDFLWYSGARLSTALRLNMSDVIFDQNFIILNSRKGNISKDISYRVPIASEILSTLEKYQRMGVTRPFGNINANSFSKKMQRILIRLKIKKDGISLHSIRHTFATKLVGKGVNIDIVRRLLGHSNIKTTQDYLLFNDNDLQDAFL